MLARIEDEIIEDFEREEGRLLDRIIDSPFSSILRNLLTKFKMKVKLVYEAL